MKMLIVVAIMGNLHDTKVAWGSLLHTVHEADLMIIDNGGDTDEGQEEFFNRFVVPHWPGRVQYIPFVDNLGVIKSYQYAYENSDHDILCYIHNDVAVYTPGWDSTIMHLAERQSRFGLAGFVGAEGVHPNGGRFNVHNNMLEAEIHGSRTDHIRQIAVLDGLCMAASRKMLDARNGLDLDYQVHHYYDLDLSVESLDRGFYNFYVPISHHHMSGKTACAPQFNDWLDKQMNMTGGEAQQAIFQLNMSRFQQKWIGKLTYSVNDGDFHR